MSDLNQQPNYLRVDEAARILRVAPRTVYRRIWSGELPASKVGGIYLIKKEDLVDILNQAAIAAPIERAEEETSTSPLKCGQCFRLLVSDTQIGEMCLAEGCERLLCTQCLADGIQYCAQHQPSRAEMVGAMTERYQRGEIPLLLMGRDARLLEMNFINRIQERLGRTASLIHPGSGEVLTVSNWDSILEQNDERAEVMRLLGKSVLDSQTLAQQPANSSLLFRIPPTKKQKGQPLEIYIQVLSHLTAILKDGFDTQPFTADELQNWLLRESEDVQRASSFRMVVLAASTGWDSGARQIIQGESLGTAFLHRSLLFYLFDLQSGRLTYNLRDDRASRYTELFAPLTLSEELEEISTAIEKELIAFESLTLEYAAQILPYSQEKLLQAFERLAASGKYSLTEVPKLGTAIVRRI